MENFKNFGIGSIVWAYYLKDADEETMQKDIDYFRSYIPLNKVYLENHRGLIDVPKEKIRLAREVFERNGIKASGCITSTGLVDERRSAIFDTYCYTRQEDRDAYVKIVEELAEVVDEIILDDYFFFSCRCEKCIKAKGQKSWSEYRLGVMEDFSKVIVKRAKEVNSKMNFIIKYPNWYESWQETGYNPEKQKDIFDMIYSGTETREAVYSQQHLQRYHSYSMVRYMENVAPNRNGGGWIDPYAADDNMSRFLEQAELTVLAKAKELMLFNFEVVMKQFDTLPSLGKYLIRFDNILSQVENPVGVSVYEPYNGDGEDLLYTYLGMGGVAVEPTPIFKDDAPTVFCAESACVDANIMEKLKTYVMNGGNAVVTTGFMRRQYDNGIKDMTSLRFTGRHMSGSEYLIGFSNYTDSSVAEGKEDVLFEVLQYKTNASWADVSVVSGEYNFPILSEDKYGKGRLFILNVPENLADLYKLPLDVWAAISKVLSMGQDVYAASDEKISLFAYENGIYGIQNYSVRPAKVRVYVRRELKGLINIETKEKYSAIIPMPKPGCWFDCCTFIPEDEEYAVEIKLGPGEVRFLSIER